MQNLLGRKTFADVVMFFVDVSGCNDDGIFSWAYAISEAVLWNKGNASAAVCKFRRIKKLQCGPVSAKGNQAMIKRSEKTM